MSHLRKLAATCNPGLQACTRPSTVEYVSARPAASSDAHDMFAGAHLTAMHQTSLHNKWGNPSRRLALLCSIVGTSAPTHRLRGHHMSTAHS